MLYAWTYETRALSAIAAASCTTVVDWTHVVGDAVQCRVAVVQATADERLKQRVCVGGDREV